MTVQYSIQKMVSDGTLSTIALGIQYLQRNDIYMRIAGEETPQSGAPSGYTWSFINNTTLKILPVVPNGVEVVVYRRTDVDAMYNIYSQNAQFDEATIDENNQQLLYIAQEYLEQGLPGAGVDTLEYVRDDGSFTYYRMRRTDGSYSEEFSVPSASSSTKVLAREAIRRSYAVAGLTLVSGGFEVGGTISNSGQVLLFEAEGKAYSWGGVLPKSVLAGSTPTSSGGVGPTAWVDQSNNLPKITLQTVGDIPLQSSLAVGQSVRWLGYYLPSDGGGNWGIVKLGPHVADGGHIFSINTNMYIEANLEGARVSILKFGAKGDFNSTTGVGTANLVPIQNAIDYVQSVGGGDVYVPPGDYYLGAAYKSGENPNLAINLLVGSITSKGLPFVAGVHMKGVNAKLYAGNTGRMVHFARANKCSISGFSFYHYTGGPNGLLKALASNCIRVSDSCKDIDIYNNYLTNYLAWGIDILSDAEDPTSSNYMVKNINIYNNTIKTRRGDGRWMASGWQEGTNDGTAGGWVIAVINGEDISIRNNVLYGIIDMENNAVGQTFYNISITNNNFRSGWVTPQLVVPSASGDNWHDEPTNPRGALGKQEIRQGIYHVGVGLNNGSTNVVAEGNTFEKGHILFWQNYALKVINNHFKQGKIEVGYTKNGTEQITRAPVVTDNSAEQRHSDFPVGGFIGLKGLVPDAQIQRNSIESSDGFGVITEEQLVGNAVSGSSGNFDGNYSKIEFPIVVGTYRLFVAPLLTPVVEVDVSGFLYGGVGFATKKVYGGGWKKGAAVNSGYVVTASVTQGTSITIGVPVEDSVGNFSLDIVVSSSNGVVNVATTKGYANASITKIA